MRQSFVITLTVWFIVVAGCNNDDSNPTATTIQLPSGTSTVSSAGAGGFSFSQGKAMVRPFAADSWPDFEIFAETGSGGPQVLGLGFFGTTPNQDPRDTFRLLRQSSSGDTAQAFFEELRLIPDTTYVSQTGENQVDAPTMRPYQIYAVKTYDGRFAKLLVLSNEVSSSEVVATFSWVFQPNGTRQF
jgi:hypothetical protein